jgi:hypothetical protein
MFTSGCHFFLNSAYFLLLLLLKLLSQYCLDLLVDFLGRCSVLPHTHLIKLSLFILYLV